MRIVKLKLHDSANRVFDECQIFWIKLVFDQIVWIKNKKLCDQWIKLDKNKNRSIETQLKKKKNTELFENVLNELFDIAHSNQIL